MYNINVLTNCLIFCTSGDSLLLTQYLNSKSPLFSIVKLLVFLLVMTKHPKLTSLKGDTEYLYKVSNKVMKVHCMFECSTECTLNKQIWQ